MKEQASQIFINSQMAWKNNAFSGPVVPHVLGVDTGALLRSSGMRSQHATERVMYVATPRRWS